MGARLSRRRLPADPPIALDALPPELLVEVLSHVPPRALVTRCRPVCRAWRDVVDGPTVWLLQLARDRSAEGRALYAVAQRCPPNSEDEEEFPLCALARYCLRAPLGRNLIFNSCGEQGFRGWEVEHGGNGWAVEKNLILVPGAPSQTCFVTSFESLIHLECDVRWSFPLADPTESRGWCFKRQLVDLVMEGVWQELLDSSQIEICVADWWGARENCGCIYRLRVRLLDMYENEVVKFSASPSPVLQWTERGCRQVSHVFTNFGKGIRYVSFEQYGRDTRSWVGHYGALVTHSSVRVRIRLS
ncbi:F-box only protein 17 isoform X3 [Lagenorhynchus albirostris]|uniref:F-box only protein 17 isoform X3 n=1 Tax=Lagenorhynchus albirostris TaxID=27610 RepID=UPI0028F0291C|nr:F-box only protein 17 isoform X3 [Lagenorhynchus albirostris]